MFTKMRQKHITLKELYIFSWDFFVIHWKPLFGLTSLFTIPGIIAFVWTFPLEFFTQEVSIELLLAHTFTLQDQLGIYASTLLYMIGTLLTSASIYLFIKHHDQEEETSFAIVLREILPYIHVLLLGMAFFSILALPLFLVLIPGIIFSIYSSFWVQNIIFNRKSVLAAFSYSYQLIRGHWWRILGYSILNMLILSVLANIFSTTTDFLFTAHFPKIALGCSMIIHELTGSFFILWNAFLFIHIQHNFLKSNHPHQTELS